MGAFEESACAVSRQGGELQGKAKTFPASWLFPVNDDRFLDLLLSLSM
jgi:hypothetical protein